MKVDVQYLQKRGKNGWRYRRKIPASLRPAFANKLEIVASLGKTEAEALRKYPKVNTEVERQLSAAAAGKVIAPKPGPATELERYQSALRHARSLRLDLEWAGPEGDMDPEAIARDVIAESIAAKYPVDEEGHPVEVKADDAALLHVLLAPREKHPEPTLEDARKLYLKEKVQDDLKRTQQLQNVFEMVKAALGSDRKLSSLRRQDAKEVRDYMYDGRSAATVDRYLNTVRAVINHAIKEYDLAGTRNPFMGLEVDSRDKAEPDRRKKRGYTDAELAVARKRVLAAARDDIGLVWRILEGTGCRLAEVTGLRTIDVKLDHAVPHIDVEWHDDRRVKTKVSRRKVPLLGDALEAAKEAFKAAGDGTFLFPAYCRKGGPAAASATIGKHVRSVITDHKISPNHSLRHRMADLLDLAGVQKATRDMILGHSSGNIGQDYGSEAVRLEVAQRALKKALGLGPEGKSG